MRRWTLRILLLLILGAVTTVAVAWGCEFLGFEGYETGNWRNRISRRWTYVDGTRYLRDHPPSLIPSHYSIDEMTTYAGRGWTILEMRARAPDDAPFDLLRYRLYSSGWPFLAVTGEYVESFGNVTPGRSSYLLGNSRPRDYTPRLLPIRPLIPGLFINTLFYAAIWFGLFLCFASARRAIRRKRGLCPICAYDLRGQRMAGHRRDACATGCPECGWGRAG